MDLPSISVDRHDRLTPELRDRILQALQTPLSDEAYHTLTPGRLRELANMESANEPVLSFYLQLTPDRRTGGAWHSYWTSMSDTTLRSIHDRHLRKTLQEEFDRIQQAMQDQLPALGRGVAFFACKSLNLFQKIAVPLPLADGAWHGSRPYVRPLVRTQDEHDRFTIAVLSQGLSRFFVSQIGQVEEVFVLRAANIRRQALNHGPKDPKDNEILQALWNESRIVAGAVEQVLARYEGRYLLLSEAPDLRDGVLQHLPKEVRSRVGAEFSVELHAGPTAVAAAAESAERAVEEREEVATVQHVLDAGPQRAAWGLASTLTALWESRVATLLVDDMFAAPGARCRNCGALLETKRPSCPVCMSDSIDAVEDVVELAIEQTLREDGAFEMLRSAKAREMATRIGPMAARLRW